MKETELKLYPCYCGGEMEIKKVTQNGGMDGSYLNWELTCKKCGMTMTYAADGFYGRKYKTFEEVVNDWNRNWKSKRGGATMELKDTITQMTSEDYKERFKAEYNQLKIRLERLHSFLVKYDAGTLDFKPDCPIHVLIVQEKHMRNYLTTLKVRAEIEGIELAE